MKNHLAYLGLYFFIFQVNMIACSSLLQAKNQDNLENLKNHVDLNFSSDSHESKPLKIQFSYELVTFDSQTKNYKFSTKKDFILLGSIHKAENFWVGDYLVQLVPKNLSTGDSPSVYRAIIYKSREHDAFEERIGSLDAFGEIVDRGKHFEFLSYSYKIFYDKMGHPSLKAIIGKNVNNQFHVARSKKK
ncbi:MAG: hypothetical protein CMP11_08395 [Zetaproteobacteria bacterium]|nr:hypothetical protein [Pseudobdellovibrionaceae bacterium]|tara:strand:+ start:184 stop:750 length:567 start_codon:yes stop_codon:yes gene_type:complete